MRSSSAFATFYLAEDDQVDELFNWSTVVGKIDGSGMFLAQIAVSESSGGDTAEQRIGKVIGIDPKVIQRSGCIGRDNEAVAKTLRVDDVDVGEDSMHGTCHRLDESEVVACATDVKDGHTSGSK